MNRCVSSAKWASTILLMALVSCAEELPTELEGEGSGASGQGGSSSQGGSGDTGTGTGTYTTTSTGTGTGTGSNSNTGTGTGTGTDTGPAPTPVTWVDDAYPALIAANCTDAGCHEGVDPAGNYDLESYNEALGNGSDGTANVIPGNGASRLIVKCQDGHAACSNAEVLVLQAWIVTWNAVEM